MYLKIYLGTKEAPINSWTFLLAGNSREKGHLHSRYYEIVEIDPATAQYRSQKEFFGPLCTIQQLTAFHTLHELHNRNIRHAPPGVFVESMSKNLIERVREHYKESDAYMHRHSELFTRSFRQSFQQAMGIPQWNPHFGNPGDVDPDDL